MKVAITGSTGFIGSYLVKYFSENNFEVIAFGRKKNTNKFNTFKNTEYFSWDINNDISDTNKTNINIGKFKNINIFIHCAANLDYKKSIKILKKDNIDSLKNILNFTKDIKKFIYISSSSVYQGKYGDLKVTDQIKIADLQNSYSLTKYLAEEYIKKHFTNNKIIIIRPRAVYGKGDRVLVPEILKNQLFGRLILPGNGDTKTSISEINNLINFIAKLAINNKNNYKNSTKQGIKIYNFSSDVKIYNQLFFEITKKYNLAGIINVPLFLFKILYFFNKNKYSYIIDTFGSDKILK